MNLSDGRWTMTPPYAKVPRSVRKNVEVDQLYLEDGGTQRGRDSRIVAARTDGPEGAW